jgi:hypothetical protein
MAAQTRPLLSGDDEVIRTGLEAAQTAATVCRNVSLLCANFGFFVAT